MTLVLDQTNAAGSASFKASPIWVGLGVLALALFVVSPTQPLFTENQNTKFLYGLAKAGVGRLNEDWLVSETSTLPIFDALVFLTQKLFGGWMFYGWQIAAMAAYAAALCGLGYTVGLTVNGRRHLGRAFLPLFGVWLVALHSQNATGKLFEGVALQYVNGTVFEPASFGVLQLLGLLLFRLGQPGWATVLVIAACWIHPAYAISGLMILTGFMVAHIRFRDAATRMPLLNFVAGTVGCLGAAGFTYSLLQPSDPAVQAEAVRIITELRIPYHSLPEIWVDFDAVAKLALVGAAIWVARNDPIGWVLLTVIAAIIASTIYVWLFHNLDMALAAPWRASAVIVPAAAAILLARGIEAMASWSELRPALRSAGVAVTAAAILLACGFAVRNKLREFVEPQEPTYYAWVRQTAHPGDLYLTPVTAQDFRLATGQPQYVTWKTHPYRGRRVLEWYDRVQRARAATEPEKPECSALEGLAAEGVTHIVRRDPDGATGCPGWAVVFDDGRDVVSTRRGLHTR
jgi:hypothetical protein